MGYVSETHLCRVSLSCLRLEVSQAEPETRILTQVDDVRGNPSTQGREGAEAGIPSSLAGGHWLGGIISLTLLAHCMHR